MRGKEQRTGMGLGFDGITPAYAGKSRHEHHDQRQHQDHPRLCGEKPEYRFPYMLLEGSPPPMRGKVGGLQSLGSWNRITPAYAGKSVQRSKYFNSIRDHPRLCGEKRAAVQPYNRVSRITPAYAGKSQSRKIVT